MKKLILCCAACLAAVAVQAADANKPAQPSAAGAQDCCGDDCCAKPAPKKIQSPKGAEQFGKKK